MDKTRPVLVLTREAVFGARDVTVAGISSAIRGVATELPVGKDNGLGHECVVNLDDVQTIRRTDLGRFMGYLGVHQESAMHHALIRALISMTGACPADVRRHRCACHWPGDPAGRSRC